MMFLAGLKEKIYINHSNGRQVKAMRFITLIMMGLCFIGVPAPWAQRIAIFDYDDREQFPDALSLHIEAKLRALSGDIKVEHYTGKNDEAQSVRILSELDKQGFDLIIVRTSDALIIAQHTLFNTPTLYTNVNNPKILGFRTLGPPKGNISGVSYYIPIKKHLSVYKFLQPSLKKPGFIFDKNNQSRKAEVPEAREACTELGLLFDTELVEKKEQLRHAVRALMDRGADAIVAATSGIIYEHIDSFLDITDNAGIPVYSFYKTGVLKGAVAAMSSDFFQMADELLLPMARKVLRDKVNPGDMPAAFLKMNKVFINVSQARKFQLEIPPKIVVEGLEIKVEKTWQ